MKLTEAEKQSALWEKLKAHFDERLQSFRKQNDQDLNERQTAEIRGRIKELKYVIDLETSPSNLTDANE